MDKHLWGGMNCEIRAHRAARCTIATVTIPRSKGHSARRRALRQIAPSNRRRSLVSSRKIPYIPARSRPFSYLAPTRLGTYSSSMEIGVINGPNLDRLGKREPEVYGTQTLGDLEKLIEKHAKAAGAKTRFFQSNHEGEIIDTIAKWADKGVKFQAISTSEIKISVLIDAAYAELAVRALHSAYGLDAV